MTETASRNRALLAANARIRVSLPARYAHASAHLTCPATVWKYVKKAVEESPADLVMLDLEDSVPRGQTALLAEGRDNVVRALVELDWGVRLRFFRPRGTEEDPGHEDLEHVITRAGRRLEGVVLPKVESADEVKSVDDTITRLERDHGLSEGAIRLHVLIESALADQRVFEIAQSSPRIAGLVYGAFDHWSSHGMTVPHRADHPLAVDTRVRIVKAASAVGVPAIAEMTLDFPTRDKTETQRAAALETCRRDASRARDEGFRAKWAGIPDQARVVREVFAPDDAELARAVREVRAFADAVARGLGAVMIDGKMADRATDRMARTVLERALAAGKLERSIADELGLDPR